MMRLLNLIAILILIVAPSCHQTASNAKTTNKKLVIDGLELNNGEKWKANPETTEGINNMISLVENMSEQPTVEDYHNLGLALEKEKKYILNQCTMNGVAHDNLHQYLMPLIRRINGVKEVESIEKGNKIYSYIKNHLNAYSDYFE